MSIHVTDEVEDGKFTIKLLVKEEGQRLKKKVMSHKPNRRGNKQRRKVNEDEK